MCYHYNVNYQIIIIIDLIITYFHRFVPRTIENDYIKIFRDGGCYSHLGKKFGEQDLSLAVGCLYSVGTPIHEFMHAIGMHSNLPNPKILRNFNLSFTKLLIKHPFQQKVPLKRLST